MSTSPLQRATSAPVFWLSYLRGDTCKRNNNTFTLLLLLLPSHFLTKQRLDVEDSNSIADFRSDERIQKRLKEANNTTAKNTQNERKENVR
jgi:anaerobic C4-dicarboxylate transporter